MKHTLLVSRRVALLLASALPLLAEEDSSGSRTVPMMDVTELLDVGNSVEELPNQDTLTSLDTFHVAQESVDGTTATILLDGWGDTAIVRHKRLLQPQRSVPHKQSTGRDWARAAPPQHRSWTSSSSQQRFTANFEPWPDWMADYNVENSYFPFFAFDDGSDDDEDFTINLITTELLNAAQQSETLKNATGNMVVEPIEGVPKSFIEGDASLNANHSYRFENATPTEAHTRAAQSMDGDETVTDVEVMDGDFELVEENVDSTQQNASEATDDKLQDPSEPDTTNQIDTFVEIEASPPITETVKSSEEDQVTLKHVAVDYASKAVGALILDSSPNFQGASNLLQKDNDKYAIVPCDEENKYVVIGLSEDILVKQIVLSNFERYSSHMKEIHLSGSTTTALESKDWVDLGTYVTTPVSGGIRKQTFDLKEPTWARYLRFEFLSHYGDEYYCTVSQISVHGSTMVQGFHEQWAELESIQESEEDVPSVTETDSPVLMDESVMDNNANDAAPVADAMPDGDSLRTLNDEITDTVDLQRADTGTVRRFPQPFKSCFSHTSRSCPASQDFMPFLSRNTSDYDALSSASICLSSSLRATSNQSFLGTDRLRLRNWSREPKSDHRFGRSAEFTRISSGIVGTGFISNALEKPSPVVDRIMDIIRQTANAVNMEGIGSSLFRALPVRSEPHSDNGTESPAKEVETTREEEEVKQVPPTPMSSKSESTVEKVAEFDVSDANHALAKLLQRLPSSKCLGKLDFPGFKKEFLALRSKGSGQHEKSHSSGVPMEPIFKKLTDEIKALQANVAVHDQFAKEYILCYQSVLLDVLTEMESLRAVHDARISKLENDFYVGPWLVTLWRLSTESLLWVLQPVCRVLLTLLQENAKAQDAVASTTAALALLFFYIWNRRRMNHSIWLSRRIQKQQESDLENRHGPATPKRDDTKAIRETQSSPFSVATISPEHSVASNSSHSAGRKKLASNGGPRKRRPLTGRLFVK